MIFIHSTTDNLLLIQFIQFMSIAYFVTLFLLMILAARNIYLKASKYKEKEIKVIKLVPIVGEENISNITNLEIDEDDFRFSEMTLIDGQLAVLKGFDDDTNEFIFIFPDNPERSEERFIDITHLEPVMQEPK